jgi:hypothetical protein
MRTAPLFLAAMLGGCFWGGDDEPPPDAALPDAAPPGTCVPDQLRDDRTASVSGQVVDFASKAPVAGATVEVTTAWDVNGGFPVGCPMQGTFTTDDQGRFGPALVAIGSSINPPIVLFKVTGAGRAPTASDARAICSGADCGNLGHTIAAPAEALAATWRTELAAGGMNDAATRGLVLFEFREMDGAPAAGVTPTQGQATMVDLEPGTQVRFLDADRSTLLGAAEGVTGGSGVAVIGVGTSGVAYVAGRRDADRWNALGVLLPGGWWFLEDERKAP